MVINHASGRLWLRGDAYDTPILAGLLGGGAVTVFFVVGSFIVTHNLLREMDRGLMDPIRFYLRRLVRLGVQLVPLCAVLVLVFRFDPLVDVTALQMVNNLSHVLTYTLNEYGQSDFFSVRPEVGHLWYLSVQQQCYLVLPLLLVLFREHRGVLVLGLVGLIVLIYQARQNVLDERGWVLASSMTMTRADGLVWGVVLALCLPWLQAYVRSWGHVLWISAAVLVTLKLWLPELSPFAYLGPWSLAFTAVAGVVVVSVWCLQTPTRISRFLSLGPLVRMGRASLGIFIWHLPVIVIVSRHTTDWPWALRAALVAVIIAGIVIVMERYVEDRVRTWLATSSIFRMPQATVEGRTPAP